MLFRSEVQESLSQGKLAPPEDKGPSDPRFQNPLWDEHPYFNFVKQQYLLSAEAVHEAVSNLDDMDDTEIGRASCRERV